MNNDHYRKAILASTTPWHELRCWSFHMMESGLAFEDVSKEVERFCHENSANFTIEFASYISLILRENKSFMPLKQALVTALRADRTREVSRDSPLKNIATDLMAKGTSRKEVYDIFNAFYAYVSWRHYEVGDPAFSEQDADWLSDTILDDLSSCRPFPETPYS